ncbi:bestrophin-like domain [Streptomyces lutosisoli]|uniref:DUF4239 domain-containing protein n=1 Tax=Streptomyces lutosisoli TaxID=2665721 RepID=A0ABW2VG31_9ACTN
MPMLGILLLLVCSAAATAALFAVARVVPLAKRKPNNEVLGFVYAQVGVIYAVVLAMVVVGVWDARSQAHENTYTETNALLQIAWFSRTLPQPDRARLAALTERYTGTVIHEEWPQLADQRDDPAAWRQFTEIRETINSLEPETGADQARYQGALDAAAQLGNARRWGSPRSSEAESGGG